MLDFAKEPGIVAYGMSLNRATPFGGREGEERGVAVNILLKSAGYSESFHYYECSGGCCIEPLSKN
jgi:hypothetical protein